MEDIIITAIKNKKRLNLVYDGFRCIVEPYTIGETKYGKIILHCYQKDTDQDNVLQTRWRTLDVSRIEEMDIMEHAFTARHDISEANDNKRICKIIYDINIE